MKTAASWDFQHQLEASEVLWLPSSRHKERKNPAEEGPTIYKSEEGRIPVSNQRHFSIMIELK